MICKFCLCSVSCDVKLCLTVHVQCSVITPLAQLPEMGLGDLTVAVYPR